MSRFVSAEELLVLLNSNKKLIFVAKILLKLFFSNLLHPLELKAPPMVLSNGNVFKIDFILKWSYFLLVRKMRTFSHEKVVIMQSDACRWFYAAIFAKWLPLSCDKRYCKTDKGVSSSFCQNNLRRIICAQLNINSILHILIFYLMGLQENVDAFMISATEIDDTFP